MLGIAHLLYLPRCPLLCVLVALGLVLSGAERGRANDLTLVIDFDKENAARRNQDMENDHNNMERERNSVQNV